VVDDGDFFRTAARQPKNIVTGFARMEGASIASWPQPDGAGGCLDIKSSIKAARFVRFLRRVQHPVVTFVDVPGFMPGTAQSTAASSSTVPSCSTPMPSARCRRSRFITRKAYGGAYDV